MAYHALDGVPIIAAVTFGQSQCVDMRLISIIAVKVYGARRKLGMTMTRRFMAMAAAAGSAALLLGALAFQYLGGLAPCAMCIWQRWSHVVAIAIGVLVWFVPRRIFCWLGATAPLASMAIGIFHTGVERKWWDGPASCTGSSNALSGLSGADLMSTTAPVHMVMCDQVAWQMLGLSMASWNAIASFILALVWIAAARQPQSR